LFYADHEKRNRRTDPVQAGDAKGCKIGQVAVEMTILTNELHWQVLHT
jgi:hypothetical protein